MDLLREANKMNEIQKIINIIENDDDCFAFYGIRATTEEHLAGEELSNSFVWIDGEKTEEELDGISTMGIKDLTEEAVIRAIKCLGRDACEYFGVKANVFHSYVGQNFVLIKGDSATAGDDNGEWVIKNPVVVAVL
nr:MAG TPA: hypothetical protein [Caudoviricetes sp.]